MTFPVADDTSVDGQLDDAFQARLAQANARIPADRCDFYHTMEWPNGDVTPGVWDLRGRERSYLGWVDVAGRSVLEFGPASGYLSFYMEQQGGRVVTFDLPPGVPTDILPQVGHDLDAHRRLNLAYMERVRNSWWYAHERRQSKARAVYGDIYRLPRDLPRFDVATFGSILMHLSRPFFALQQAAELTDKALIVTEPIPAIPVEPDRPITEFAPIETSKTVVVWWQHTPAAIIRMLRVLGFLEFYVYYHVQKHHVHHELERPAEESLFFTVVAERHKGWAPRLARTDAEIAAERAIIERWSAPPVASAPDAAEELLGMQSSLSWKVTRPLRAVGSLLRRAGLR